MRLMIMLRVWVFLSTLVVQNAATAQTGGARTTPGPLAIEAIDRRSGRRTSLTTVVGKPRYYRLRLYTQTNSTTRSPSPGYLCSQCRYHVERAADADVPP